MKTVTKNQKGFIKITILIAVIIGVIVVCGIGYISLQQYQKYQTGKVEKARIAQEKEKETQALAEAQKKTIEETQLEIEKLKEESAESKKKQETLEQKVQSNQQKPTPQNITISAAELDLYLTGVVNVICGSLSGSGTLQIYSYEYFVLTNLHVLEDPKESCEIIISAQDNRPIGMYLSDPSKLLSWNNLTDVIVLKVGIKKPIINGGIDYTEKSEDINKLNYKISNLPYCSMTVPVGTPVVIIGYPAYGVIRSTLDGYPIQESVRVVSNGIISGYDNTVKDTHKLPYSNYFVSAKIDSGNSGGIALSKNEKGLCVLGIPTWLTIGNYETQGVVQNIYNIMYKE